MSVDPDGHQVDSVGPEGAATHQAPGRQRQPAPEAMDAEGLDGVVRAAGIEAARRDPARGGALIGLEQGDGQARTGRLSRSPGPRSSGAHAVTAAWPARRRARATSVRNWRRVEPGGAGVEADQVGPSGQRGGLRPHHLAGPAAQPVAGDRAAAAAANCVADLGKYTGHAVVDRDEGHRIGPHAPRARARCRSAKAARLVMRPTVRAGKARTSDGETVAPLEPPRLQDGPPRPGGHALAEPVGAGPFPGVGLVGALHVKSAFRDAVFRDAGAMSGTGSSRGPRLGRPVESGRQRRVLPC